MPGVWDADDLRFALVQSWFFGSPRQVADDLLAAAAQSAAKLRDVTPLAARVRAAEVLMEAGERADGIAVLELALQATASGAEPADLLAAAGAWVTAGEPGQAEAVAIRAIETSHHAAAPTAGCVAVAFRLAEQGYFDQALGIIDAMTAQAAKATGSREQLNLRVMQLSEMARTEILKHREELQISAPGGGSAEAAALRSGGRRPRPARETVSEPPWPAVVESCLLWWPETEYGRITGHVPDLRSVLGATWREHTGIVESAMRAAQGQAGPGGLSLAAASYEGFVRYLEHTGADPRLPQVMTGFTRARARGSALASWPSGPGDPCWCGSRKKYRRCCQGASAA